MASTPEGKVKAAVKKLLHEQGFIQAGTIPAKWPENPSGWYYMPSQNGMGVVGIPDFICCWNGRFLAIETKAPGKRHTTSANQDQRILEITTANGLVLVCDDVEQLREVLDTPTTMR